MYRKRSILLILILFAGMQQQAQHMESNAHFNWTRAKDIPDPEGFAGSYAGVSNGALLVAGGANFPNDTRPWTGGVKTWYDKIFVLEEPDGEWKEAGKLPRPMGYGIALTWKDAVICLGGGNADSHFADAFMLRYTEGKIETVMLPALPAPLINACGTLIGDVVYVAGGIETPTAKAVSRFCSLDLADPAKGWKILDPVPGGPRMLSVAGTVNGSVHIFGGVRLEQRTGEPSLVRSYLKDAWAYHPVKGWKKCADMPHTLAAAPSPAYAAGQSHLLVFGGDDGALASRTQALRDSHPGFRNELLAYNSITDKWSVMGQIPTEQKPDAVSDPHGSTYAPVTTPLVVWNGMVVIPGGEARPAVRTNKVRLATPYKVAGKFAAADWSVILIYFLLVAGISIFITRRMGDTTGDFFLGGQKIPWWAAGLSIFGSKLSALTFIAIPAKAYSTDWVFAMNNVMILVVAPIVTHFYLPYFRKLRITSVYEYLQIRFNRRVKMIGSLTFTVFQLSRLGVVIYLPALVLSTVTGMNIILCILLTTLITTAYSVAGGIEAVVWTEVLQVFVLLGGAVASLLFISLNTKGGFTAMMNEASAHDKLRVANMGWAMSEPVLWVVLLGAFLTNLVTYTSDQVVVQRYLTTATEQEARRSIWTNALMAIPATLIFFSVGTALWIFFRNNPATLDPFGRNDDVFPWFIARQLPSGLSGLVIAGLFAATMATISSSMNAIATVVTTDFYGHYKKNASERQRLRFARYCTVVLGLIGSVIAVYMVYLDNASIFDQYLKIIGLFGGALAGIFVAGIFFPKITATGITAGFICSCVSLYFIQASDRVNFFLYPVFAVLVCVVTGYLFSVLFPGPANGSPAADD